MTGTMTEDDFKKISLVKKWAHIKQTMDYIVNMDAKYAETANLFSLRRRINPHHPPAAVYEETAKVKEQQRNLRTDQYERWAHLKNLYAENRDELTDTLGNSDYEACKSIIENIFTQEVDDTLRNILE